MKKYNSLGCIVFVSQNPKTVNEDFYSNAVYDVFLMSIDGKKTTKLFSLETTEQFCKINACLTKNNKIIFVNPKIDRNNKNKVRIDVFDIDKNEIKNLLIGEGTILSLDVSSDVSKICYLGSGPYETQRVITAISLNDKNKNLINKNIDGLPRWSPDGTKIAFSDERKIAIIDMKTNKVLDVASGGRCVFPSWSPDGKKIIFTRFISGYETPGDIFIVNSDGKNEQRITTTYKEKDYCINARFSLDGKKVIFIQNKKLHSIDILSNKKTVLSNIEVIEFNIGI
jgi:Tol biopolymer transport system component